MIFRFAYPIILALLPLVAGWMVFSLKKTPSSIIVPITSKLVQLGGKGHLYFIQLPILLKTVCLILIVLSAARPQTYHASADILSPGVDIMLALDTSWSMAKEDFRLKGKNISRLAAVKKVVKDFIEKRKMDRIGLVVFGSNAFTQSPLTMDKGLLMNLIERISVGMAGNETAIGTAVAVGLG